LNDIGGTTVMLKHIVFILTGKCVTKIARSSLHTVYKKAFVIENYIPQT